ncbi:MAG: hypothetical protein QJR05_12130 [Thermoanaerobacterium sp.]|nr:hypothetical protein [Thermoanaerobacterium sp.]
MTTNISSNRYTMSMPTVVLLKFTLKPNDIDIQTDKKGAYQIEECFKEFVIAKVCFPSNGKISSYFGCLEIDDIIIA